MVTRKPDSSDFCLDSLRLNIRRSTDIICSGSLGFLAPLYHSPTPFVGDHLRKSNMSQHAYLYAYAPEVPDCMCDLANRTCRAQKRHDGK